ncbi:His Kinase A (phospho-acceptor) domain-containing protein [Vreelandella subterranea]|uniref:histidine kinase n=1 Tax=Vreelandella subterranea TaxID=416874 RepID=A0A1H9P5C0_9GAMM|nr:ATP-binding protein [Halomonas subterranea]SER43494.1 His Kinase A (phospho-acceptor) domain-containing protein [Halomonas subterranea]
MSIHFAHPILRRFQWVALIVAACVIVAMGWQGIRVQEALLSSNDAVQEHLETITLIQEFRSTLLDLETGERGYVVTGQPSYLLPYQQARAQLADKREQLGQTPAFTSADNGQSIEDFDALVARRVEIAEANIAVRESDGLEAAALRLLVAGGKQTMDQLRNHLGMWERMERGHLNAQTQEATRQARTSRWIWGAGAAFVTLLLIITSVSIISQWHHRQRTMSMQQTFISTVSHELRTPLTVILGTLNMLHNGIGGALDKDLVRLIAVANDNGKRLKLLIDDILDIEKLESGQLAFKWQSVPLKSLVEEAVDINQPYAESFAISLVLAPQPSTPPGVNDALGETLENSDCVEVDPERFAQVMANLISNACKHSPQGAQVVVGMRRIDNRWLEVSVTDNGNGIPWSFQPRVFERFAQADGSDKRRTGGTGLGLAITKALVEEMGGTIGFHSVPHEGSCFWVRLPKDKKHE